MKSNILKLAGLIGLLLALTLLSACAAEPTPAVKAPSLPPTLASQLPALQSTRAGQLSTTPAADRVATVQRGTIRTGVNASGKLVPAKSIKLSFGAPGTVKDILVGEGQPVKAGEVLARLDTTELEQAVTAAQQALANQQLSYSLAITPTRSEVAAARAALASANANLAYLQSLPNPTQVEIARLQLAMARSGRLVTPEQAQIAELQYDLAQRGSTEAQLAAASAQVAQAQVQWDKILVTDERQQTLAAMPLKQAELDLQAAQQRLDSAQLKSPIDGVISNLTLSLGDRVGSEPVAVVSDVSAFDVAFGVDEASVGMLSARQPAAVVIAMFPDRAWTGTVKSVAFMPTQAADASSYRVVVGLDKIDVPVRSGMSADVSIIVGQSDNVLVIPSWAIRTDRSAGKTYAYVKRGSQVEETEIVTGLYDASQIEVKSGLTEGDVVVVPPKVSP